MSRRSAGQAAGRTPKRPTDAARGRTATPTAEPAPLAAGSSASGDRPAELDALGRRVAALDWSAVHAELHAAGVAVAGAVLDAEQCQALRDCYDDAGRFRSTIDMAQHRFGAGQYRYFAAPLPELVSGLRSALWPYLLPVARQWADLLGRPAPWPDRLDDWLAACHEAGQVRQTPLLLRYGPGDWNALHRDLYGDLVFPLQVVVGLDTPGEDYTGGELVVVEQRPRAQSKATVLSLVRGEAVVVTTSDRPVRSARGWSAAPTRHGVSVLRSGRRHALGVLFHDAR